MLFQSPPKTPDAPESLCKPPPHKAQTCYSPRPRYENYNTYTSSGRMAPARKSQVSSSPKNSSTPPPLSGHLETMNRNPTSTLSQPESKHPECLSCLFRSGPDSLSRTLRERRPEYKSYDPRHSIPNALSNLVGQVVSIHSEEYSQPVNVHGLLE